MAHTSIWVPGTIIQAEHLHQLVHVIRKGWGTFFKQEGGFNWFHIPVATPWTLDGHDLALTTVFVFYRVTNGPQITNIHLYSGPKRVHAFDGLHATGENTVMKDGAMNMWDLPSPVFIDSGLGISVGVDFEDGGEILFTGAGGYFQSSEQ